MRRCEVWQLGCVDYQSAWELQDRLVQQRSQNNAPDRLLLLEHPHTYTLGSAGHQEYILFSEAERATRGITVVQTDRGGDVTYHGPGQLVGYPIINLKPDRCDVHRYVRDIEDVLIRTIAEFGITGTRIPGLTGVWVGNEKIGAIGVRIARWITSHGFALNVNTDLSYFNMIVPCGISDKGVTSLSRLVDRTIDTHEVAHCAALNFGRVLGRDVVLNLNTDDRNTPETEVRI